MYSLAEEPEGEDSSVGVAFSHIVSRYDDGSAMPDLRYHGDRVYAEARMRQNWGGADEESVRDMLGEQFFGKKISEKVYKRLAALSGRTSGNVEKARELLLKARNSSNTIFSYGPKDYVLRKGDLEAAHKMLDEEDEAEEARKQESRRRASKLEERRRKKKEKGALTKTGRCNS